MKEFSDETGSGWDFESTEDFQEWVNSIATVAISALWKVAEERHAAEVAAGRE